MRFCSSQLQPVGFPSKSNPAKSHTVNLRPVDSAYPSCSCMAAIMSKSRARSALKVLSDDKNVDVPSSCKHIASAVKQTCDWEADFPEASFTLDASGGMACPKCGNETVRAGSDVEAARPVIVEPEPGPAPTVGMRELIPMLAEEVAADRLAGFAGDDDRWFQQKVDGHRVLIHVQGGVPTVYGRNGQISQHAARFNQPAYRDLARLPDCVIDGELVDDVLWIFDLPHHGGIVDGHGYSVTCDSPYRDRQEALEQMFGRWAPDDRYFRLLPTAKTHGDKAELALHLLRNQGEGVIVRHVDGKYQPGGRGKDILKAKFVREADVWVSAIGEKGHESYSLSVLHNGKPVSVGKCSAIGKAKCDVDDVISVRFLYVAANGRLYQPRMVAGPRADKTKAECTWEGQLDVAGVDKTVHPALPSMSS